MKKNFILVLLMIAVIVAAVIWFANDRGNNSSLPLPLENATTSTNADVSPAAPAAQAVYNCDGGKTISAEFYKGEQIKVEPGQPPVPTGRVKLVLSDGRNLELAQTISADGGRYANTDESFVFWDKGGPALILENGEEIRLYKLRCGRNQFVGAIIFEYGGKKGAGGFDETAGKA